ncbi:PREDICTED: targeting protein for Xklp2-B-like [Ceratosolen solmsi marchali]|uniref:Targeting protein for Xklp2-B-like n=1 Tax=Ceratosolen solmsi marchali TaxID=326594 RepID=A0AAJ6YG97_9HYME|nr:PREDICTED: targeting protein for Xklp2-B-like [Ceratosolen solmsi marchali]
MDNLDAPQWADFIAPSPQISLDDYFLRKHVDHEYREKFDSVDSVSPDIPTEQFNLSKQSSNESLIQKTPMRIKCGQGNKILSSKKNIVKETTYENVLLEAMSNLQLSFKKQLGEKSFNKSCLVDSPAFKTPIKRITRSMCAQANMTPKYCISMHEKSTKNNDHDQIQNNKENINIEKYQNPTNEQINSSQINLEVTSTSTEHEVSDEKLKSEAEPRLEQEEGLTMENENSLNQLPMSKVVTSFSNHLLDSGNSSKKKVTTLTGTAWHRQVKRRMSITNQRRLSINKSIIKNKYVSMAEAVTKFHRATPQRFHSTTIKATKTEQLRRMSFKLTRATSPALMCKNRSRPVTAISREEQERIELAKIRQNQIKANPVRKNILIKPAPLKKVEKKMVTHPEPFHLTEVKKWQPIKKTEQIQETKRIHRTKTVPSIVSTNDKGIIVKDEEVLHFGIPLEPCKTKKKNTKVMPFSFEARNRELHIKKQEKLKLMLEMEQQKNKTEFHARPVPATIKTPLLNRQIQNENSLNKPKITIARSLSFEERHKQLQLKKEEKIKQLLEEEKKARTFKAQKVPEFKPVLIKGRSRDNLLKKSQENLSWKSGNVSGNSKAANNSLKKSRENLTLKQKNFIKQPMSIPFVVPKKTSRSPVDPENQENRNHGAVPKILEPKCKLSQKSISVLTELNTDKRAKQRKEFDEQIKKKEIADNEMRKREEEERLAKEKAQKMELRKMTEIKARPMPIYKLLNITKSNKPLTDAHSPIWAKRKGSTH